MRKFFEIGGLVAAAVLIAFGVAAIVMGINGRSTVRDSLKLEQIVGTPDMTPTAIAAEAKKAGLPASITLPTTDVAGKAINTGARARAFASYMRIHTLEATGGVPYSQMPRYATANGKGTNDPKAALQSNGQPVDNAARNIWVTETALTTALNTSYMAEQLALFGIVVGVALLLSGLGFSILAIGGALRNPENALNGLFGSPSGAKPLATA
jgi:F0F1-type ATP synthase membrane subunit c/vacuolar-type H+-ATPase subunit K